MNSKEYIINNEVIILERNSVFFSSKLSTKDLTIQLQVLDIILLELVNKGLLINQAAKSFMDKKSVKNTFPSINIGNIIERLNVLINSNLLQIKSNINTLKTYDSHNIFCPKNIKYSKKATYKISKNFALLPTEIGYVMWSAKLNKYFHLKLKELIILLAFTKLNDSNNIHDNFSYFKKSKTRKIISKLVFCGLLVQPPNFKNRIKEKHNHSKKVLNGINWQDIPVDNRIPVYFVPHMENHFPLALGLLYSSIEKYNDGDLLKYFNLIPISYLTPEILLNKVYRKFGKGIWLFSNYMWSIDLNLEISRLVKQHNHQNVTIHGGPSTPNYKKASENFMDKNSSIDISVHGEGEIAICEILKCIYSNDFNAITFDYTSLEGVSGITIRMLQQMDSNYIRTIDRVRMTDPDKIPSPYLNNVFKSYNGKVDAAIIESNRGCPFGCTFCDWGSATNQKVRKYDLQRTKDEITWIGKNKVRIIWIADANFGMFDRDIELSKHIVKIKEKYGYPQEVVVNYTKNTTWRLAEIIKIFSEGKIISQGIISIQTTDKMTLEVINRKNIKTQKYDELTKVFSEMNLPLSTDLMIGLPGITVSAFKSDLQRYIDLDVSVKAYPTQLLPNSPMADPAYIEKYKITTDQNSFITSSFSFTENELTYMKNLYQYYTIAEGYSLLRYILRYMQWEYNILAIDFIEKLMVELKQDNSDYPFLKWAFKFFESEKCMPSGWELFFIDLENYVHNSYEDIDKSSLKTVIYVNKCSMPEDSINYPLIIKTQYDFKSYYLAKNEQNNNKKNLSDYSSGSLTFDDPSSMAHINHEELQYDTHQYFWELTSDIARAKSTAL